MIATMNYYSTEAFVLLKESSGEQDNIYHFFSRDFGRLILQAKGARRILAKLAGHLEPPSLDKINFVRGHSPRLITALEEEPYLRIKKSLPALDISFRIGKLIDALLPLYQPDLNIWQLLYNIFYLVENNLRSFPDIVDFSWFYFNAQLLHFIGSTPFLDGCVICGRQTDANFFSFSQRGLVCKFHHQKGDLPLTSSQKRILKSLFYSPLSKFSRKSQIQEVMKEKKFIEKFLAQFTSLIKSDIIG